MSRLHTDNSGFTLVEMIVTLGIIAIVISLGLVNFQATGNSTSTYSSSRDLLVSDIRLAASKALNRERFQSQEPTGWGIEFPPNSPSYTVFADLNGNRSYEVNEKFKTVNLNSEVKLNWQNYTNYYPTSAVVFNAGDSKTYVNGLVIPATPTAHLQITLKNAGNAIVKTLTVTPLGTVSY